MKRKSCNDLIFQADEGATEKKQQTEEQKIDAFDLKPLSTALLAYDAKNINSPLFSGTKDTQGVVIEKEFQMNGKVYKIKQLQLEETDEHSTGGGEKRDSLEEEL